MAQILKAKPVTRSIFEQIKSDISELNLKPRLEIILIGNDPAAQWYVNNLQKKGSKLGMQINLHNLLPAISQEALSTMIDQFNLDPLIHGIMLQKPLPDHLDENLINSRINPNKDVDGFHPVNLGKLLLDQDALLPCTPQAVINILSHYKIDTAGKNVVVLGRSNIVGKPLSLLLLRKSRFGNATVTVCHSQTKDLPAVCKQADILIAAIGKAHFVTAEMIKPGAVLIDVGTNLVKDAQKGDYYTGDIDADQALPLAGAISPVPGGVGSVTTALLLANLLKSAKLSQEK